MKSSFPRDPTIDTRHSPGRSLRTCSTIAWTSDLIAASPVLWNSTNTDMPFHSTKDNSVSGAACISQVHASINIGQGLSGFATATLIAVSGSINIGDSVDGGSAVNWNAQHFNCPHQDGTRRNWFFLLTSHMS